MKKNQRKIHPDTVVLIKQISIGLLVFVVIATILTSVWFFTRWEKLTISNIDVVGGETIEHDSVESVASKSLEGNYLGFIPKQFSWLFPKNAMIDSLQQFDRIYDIKIEREGGQTINISFKEYQPVALWCANDDMYRCVFLDKSGFAFAEAPSLRGGSFLRLVSLDKEIGVDTTPFTDEVLNKLFAIENLLSERGWFVSTIETDHVGDAFVHLVNGGELKLSLSDEPEDVYENLQVILTSEDFSHLEPGNFNYIDLRFGNRVFVNEEMADEEEVVDTEIDLTATSTASST